VLLLLELTLQAELKHGVMHLDISVSDNDKVRCNSTCLNSPCILVCLNAIAFIRFVHIAIAVAVPQNMYSTSFPRRITGICNTCIRRGSGASG